MYPPSFCVSVGPEVTQFWLRDIYNNNYHAVRRVPTRFRKTDRMCSYFYLLS